jgi:hypothetical protein
VAIKSSNCLFDFFTQSSPFSCFYNIFNHSVKPIPQFIGAVNRYNIFLVAFSPDVIPHGFCRKKHLMVLRAFGMLFTFAFVHLYSPGAKLAP